MYADLYNVGTGISNPYWRLLLLLLLNTVAEGDSLRDIVWKIKISVPQWWLHWTNLLLCEQSKKRTRRHIPERPSSGSHNKKCLSGSRGKREEGGQYFVLLLHQNLRLNPTPAPQHPFCPDRKKYCSMTISICYLIIKYFTCKSMYCALVFTFSGSNSCFYINYFCHTAWQNSKLQMDFTLFQFFISIWPDVICCQWNACSVMPYGARSNKLTSHL